MSGRIGCLVAEGRPKRSMVRKCAGSSLPSYVAGVRANASHVVDRTPPSGRVVIHHARAAFDFADRGSMAVENLSADRVQTVRRNAGHVRRTIGNGAREVVGANPECGRFV